MKHIDTEIHPLLKRYIPVAEGIAETFGKHCEVVVHDLTDISTSIVAIFNGHVTGRQVGSPITSLGLNLLRKGEEGAEGLLNYLNESIKGKRIKSSSIFIRDDNEQLIGCLCINLDLTYLSVAEKVLEDMATIEIEEDKNETFPLSVSDLENQMIESAIEKIGKPVPMMDKEDRQQFICLLDEMGLFLIKGTVQKVASLLNVSKFTIYNYLDKKI